MRQELCVYEINIRELEDIGADVSELLCHLISMKRANFDVNEALTLMRIATTNPYDLRGSPILNLSDFRRALERERNLKRAYEDRKHYPHLRGGRRNQVATYANIAKTEGKETALRWARRVLSPRSMFRLKKLLHD